MTDDRIVNAVDMLRRRLAAAAILREAGRLAKHSQESPNEITPGLIQKAAEAYKMALEAAC